MDDINVWELADLPAGELIEAPIGKEKEPMGCSSGAAPSTFSLEQHLIMRFLDQDVADQVRIWLREDKPQPVQNNTNTNNTNAENEETNANSANNENNQENDTTSNLYDGRLKIKMSSDLRSASLQVEGFGNLTAKIVDLPCIIETQKTLNGYLFHKSGNVSQMMICAKDPEVLESITDNFQYSHGITPPFHNILNVGFRKPVKKSNENYYVDSEVKRLLMHDKNALGYEWEVLNADDDVGNELVEESQISYPDRGNEYSEINQEDSMSGTQVSPEDYNDFNETDNQEIAQEIENDLIGDISSSSDGDAEISDDEKFFE